MKKAIDYLAWFKQIQNAEIPALYLISGEEDFLIRQGLKAMEKKLLTPGCENLDLVKLSDKWSYGQILDEIETASFLSSKRLVILKNSGLFNNKQGSTEQKREFLANLEKSLNEGACLCLLEDKVDKRLKKNFQIFERADAVQVEVPRLKSPELLRWISAYLAKKGIRISKKAAESLILRCDFRMSDLAFELDKLANFCMYTESQEIYYELLELCCREDLQGNVFELGDAISERRTDEAFRLLDRLIKQKEPLILILFMLARHFRQLLCSKDTQDASLLAKSLGVPFFVAKRLLSQSAKFSRQDLLKLCELSRQADFAIKTGKQDERLAVEFLLLAAGQMGR